MAPRQMELDQEMDMNPALAGTEVLSYLCMCCPSSLNFQ